MGRKKTTWSACNMDRRNGKYYQLTPNTNLDKKVEMSKSKSFISASKPSNYRKIKSNVSKRERQKLKNDIKTKGHYLDIDRDVTKPNRGRHKLNSYISYLKSWKN